MCELFFSSRTWTHNDLCYVPEIPKFNISLVDGVSGAKTGENGPVGNWGDENGLDLLYYLTSSKRKFLMNLQSHHGSAQLTYIFKLMRRFEVIYQTRKTVFDHISKHREEGRKYNELRGV